MKEFLMRIKKLSTSDLAGIMGVIVVLLLYGTARLKDSSLFERFTFLESLGGALAFYIGGCIGLVYVMRRECALLPLGHKIRGTLAVLIGIVMLLLGWSFGTLFLLSIWI